MDKFMTHLILVPDAVCAGTDMLEDVDVVVGAVSAVGVMGAVVVIVALLDTLLSCVFVTL